MVSPLSRLRALQAAARDRRSAALRAAIAAGLVDDANDVDAVPVVSIMDLDLLRATCGTLRFDAGFPADALHTVAVKANPVIGVLRAFKDQGMGAEVRVRAARGGG
jgi:hypothetical protein